jgi:threonyl-tRNA synthetase
MLVVGDREAAEGTVGVRHRAGGDQGAQRTAQFIEAALGEVRSRQLAPVAAEPVR